VAMVSVYRARAESSQLIDRAAGGEEIAITRRGRPAVRLVPLEEPRPPRKAGALMGMFEVPDEFFEALPDDIIDAFCASGIFPDGKSKLFSISALLLRQPGPRA
jgi:prevent-host-death family protein